MVFAFVHIVLHRREGGVASQVHHFVVEMLHCMGGDESVYCLFWH